MNATANAARNVFLWQGALLEPFAGPTSGVSPAGASSQSSFRRWQFEPPTTRPRLLASAATETRFLSQTLLTRFCNLVNAKTDTPTSDSTSHETNAFARSVADPDFRRNRAVSGTAPKPTLFRGEPQPAPRRCLPYRSKSSESAFSVLRRERPTLTIPRTPVVADSSPVGPEEIRAVDRGQPRLPFPPPARTGEAFLKTGVPLNPRKPLQRR